MNSKRSYDMTKRAEKVAQRERKILESAIALWKELSIRDITLEKVAEISGVATRTVLRKYGTKEGLLEACLEMDAGRFDEDRENASEGDLVSSLEILLREYEETGDAVIRTIHVEEELPLAKKILKAGRDTHREWCSTIFKPYLPDMAHPEYETRLLAFVAATEIYLWKLLRRDYGCTYEQTFDIFLNTIEALITKFQN